MADIRCLRSAPVTTLVAQRAYAHGYLCRADAFVLVKTFRSKDSITSQLANSMLNFMLAARTW